MHKTIDNLIDGYTLEWYDVVESTNITATDLALKKAPEGTIVMADFQTNGRGQRNNKWESKESENLTFTLLLRPSFIAAEQQFILLKTISLGICDYLRSERLNAMTKWPNDTYVNNKKITGTLIEHSLIGENLDFSVAGIGLNLNQTVFSKDVANPTSMKLELDCNFDRLKVLKKLIACIDARYTELKRHKLDLIEKDYHNALYRGSGYHMYQTSAGEVIEAEIIQVLNTGELILEEKNGKQHTFLFKEVSFI